ncbi:TPA: hypothetical protein N0F65_008685 [Lagenidium giganteum]|uniref:DDE-1 domain-containing protein n=1 Tax=Lagenidium giganteum TaxID=4803 RepID=A0AAV2Z527_9STRA|nr:TPA: hypothetical protein N0F65_008671 [Lagenidium giganteum]DBA02471.1 TPA: hypothetical protein N0F65_008685 [Lagenidium giganteum]
MAKPIILLWDAFSGHRTGRVEVYARSVNVELIEVPAGYTWRGAFNRRMSPGPSR